MHSNIQRALILAYDQHEGQKRKCNQAPYFVHILDVAHHLMAEPTATEETIIAGILHDTLEDTPYTAQQLETDFGPQVRKLVEFATEPIKDSHTSKEDKRKTWKQRKQHTLDACETATRDQLLILLADKLSNLQSIHDDLILHGESLWDHFNADREEIAWYYLELKKVFQDRLPDTRMTQLYEKLMEEVS
jgi:(p)ppGpp synthase/HD superfamily hydrolase